MRRLVLLAVLALSAVALSARAASVEPAAGSDLRVSAPQAVVPGARDAWRLRVREAAVVREAGVRLGDIADPLGDLPRGEWERLAAVPLWPAPETPGKPLQINRQRLGDASHGVGRGGRRLSAAQFAGGAEGRRGASGRGFAIAGRQDPDAADQSFGRPRRADRFSAAGLCLHRPRRAERGFGSGRRGARPRFSGSVFLNLWMDVPCPVRPLGKGEAVTPDVITFMSCNLAYQKGAVWDGRGGPWQTVRSLGASQPILASDLTPLSAVHRGDKLTLVYTRGNVRISAMVEALEEGGPGDTIAVRNLDSKKQIYATVLDADTVTTK